VTRVSEEAVPPSGQQARLLPASVRAQLAALYSGVPAVECSCGQLGQCCELTEQEASEDFATMYPLYLAEYLNIAGHVGTHCSPTQQQALFSVTDERPVRCPFLGADQSCAIYPVRPLICRTYGVLSRTEVESTAAEARGALPAQWVWRFLSVERHTVCAHTTVREPEKVAAHARDLVGQAYERTLIEMGKALELPDEDRSAALLRVAGKPHLTRWTWGGFNVWLRSPPSWLTSQFSDYWESAFLAE